MSKANYIIFHPDRARENHEVTATVLQNGARQNGWVGNIWVDELVGNEDPFVFNEPWLYSYCHASQLRRHYRADNQSIQVGSFLIFCSGDAAERGNLMIDTLFHVGSVCEWTHNPHLSLPKSYASHFKDSASELWERHFKYPFNGVHDNVSHTYEALLYPDGSDHLYSFLPYDMRGQRVSIPIPRLPKSTARKIHGHIIGKRPVLFSDDEIAPIVNMISETATLKVVRDIRLTTRITTKKKQSCC